MIFVLLSQEIIFKEGFNLLLAFVYESNFINHNYKSPTLQLNSPFSAWSVPSFWGLYSTNQYQKNPTPSALQVNVLTQAYR